METEKDDKNKILLQAEQYASLTVPDQEPLIEKILLDFQESFSRFRQRTADQLEQLKENLREGLLTSQKDLDQVRKSLLDAFQHVRHDRVSSGSLRGLIDALERSLADLYQSIPANLGTVLEQTSPQRRVIQNLLSELTAFHRQVIEGIPLRATLVRRRGAAEDLKGKTIFDVEKKAFIDLSTRSRFPLLNRLYCYLYRLRLRYRYRAIEVPLRETVSIHLASLRLLEERELVRNHKVAHSESSSCVSDSWQVVRFNLEVAAAELSEMDTSMDRAADNKESEVGIAEIEQLVLGALERAGEKLNGAYGPIETLVAGFLLQIDQQYQTQLRLIRQDLDEAGTLRVRLRWARSAVIRSLRSFLDRSLFFAAKAARLGILLGKERYFEAEGMALKLAPSLGLAVRSDESLLRLTDLPTYEEVSGKSKNFPPIYRRLFSSAPLLTKEFLVAREKELTLLFESLRRWREGRPCSVAIIGPQGSGKTSLLNCFASELGPETVFERREIEERLSEEKEIFRLFQNWFSLSEPCHSVADVVAQVLQRPKQIVLVEGGHNLMLRTIGGGKTAETFFSIVLGTRNHLLWILSVRQYPWQRMEYQLKASQYFTHEIRTLFHNERELYEALMLRQRASGFRIIYTDEGLDNRRIRKLRLRNPLESEIVQRELEREYFKDLFDLSGGNLESALFFWLLSLSYEESEKAVRVSPCVTLDYGFLRGFDNRFLFTLAELMNHGGLTPVEHSRIFRLESSKSQLLLDYLVEIRLVECKVHCEEKKLHTYVVDPIVIHPVASILESMNILY